MIVPDWGLSIAYWLHMLATVIWIGSLTALALVVLPAARRSLEGDAYSTLLGSIQRRVDSIGWFCLVVLAGTGLFQMSAHPNYQGFLAIDNAWSVAILVKHLLFGVMIVSNVYMTWFVLPELRRSAMRRSQSQPLASALERRNTWLVNFYLILAVLILAVTAVARAS